MISVDIHEPDSIARPLLSVIPGCKIALNEYGYADYFWTGITGETHQVENKSWSELLSDLDHVEEQLQRQYPMAACNYLMVRGVIQPTEYGIDIYQHSDKRAYYHMKFQRGKPAKPLPWLYKRVSAWLWQLDKSGITIIQVPTDIAAAITLVSMYEQSQKAEHATLRRFIKRKIKIPELNPHVKSLMSIQGAGIGYVRASALIERFSTLYAVLSAGYTELSGVPGMGPAAARRLLTAIGHHTDSSVTPPRLDNHTRSTEAASENNKDASI